jgi:pimeloyl-ACP methyl ester carboxylesterase
MDAVLYVVAFAAAILAAGFLYQWTGSRHDRARFAGAGRSVEIGGRRSLYLLEKGSGGPTVLFEAGIAATNLNWSKVQEAVSGFTGTASYDRLGLGWSSPCRTLRTPGNIAGELHALLREAGIQPPYILVGHSFGGLVVRRYALLYPEEVASVLLVDPMRCEEWPPLNPGRQSEVDRGKKMTRYAVPIARIGLARLAITSLLCRSGRVSGKLAAAGGAGVRHVLGRVTEEVRKMPSEVWPVIASHWSRPGYYTGMGRYLEAIPDTVREMQGTGPIRGIPVLVLTPGRSTPLSEPLLAGIGDNVRQVIANQSAHWIHLDEPDLVIDTIRRMVAAATEPVVAAGSGSVA